MAPIPPTPNVSGQRKAARGHLSAAEASALDAVVDALLAGTSASDARLRFQQLSAAVTAKGVEDTALYRFLRSPARNEVGADPGRFCWTPEQFHAANQRDAERGNRGLLALSTHDTKRSGDVRARLAVLSEVPEDWAALLDACTPALTAAWVDEPPDPVAHHLLLHGVVGAWPIGRERLAGFMRKACREAKRATSWLRPNESYERAVERLVDVVVAGDVAETLRRFVDGILVPGRINSLGQVVFQCLGCGIPDIYRGDELWNLSLVDPDNRRPVGETAIHELAALSDMTDAPTRELHDPEDPGRPKLWTVTHALRLRARRRECFRPSASYRALRARGVAAEHVVAFARGDSVVGIAQRLSAASGSVGRHDDRPRLGHLARRAQRGAAPG